MVAELAEISRAEVGEFVSLPDELSILPIVRPSTSVNNGDHLNSFGRHPVHQEEWKAAKQVSSRFVNVRRPGFWGVSYRGDGSVQLVAESSCGDLATIPVPHEGGARLNNRVVKKFDWPRH